MQRYFVPWTLDIGKAIALNDEDAHHIKHVMRMSKGDLIEVVDNTSNVYVATILDTETIRVHVLERLEMSSELPLKASIFIPLLKGDKLDWLLQKATELGATHFYLYEAERSVVKLDHKKQLKRLTRFEKIVKEAAEQSKRLVVPTIRFVGRVHQLDIESYDAFFMAYEGLNEDTSKQLSNHVRSSFQTIACIFGPEGGFSEGEVESLSTATQIRLGPRILRAETAPLYFLSGISVIYEH